MFDRTKPGRSDDSITIYASYGGYFDWVSTLGIDAVIVKGGPNANVYVYDHFESTGNTEFHPPINPDNGNPYAISHIEFCYDYEVDISKDAQTSFTRTYAWTIDKTGDQTEITISAGQSFAVNYSVSVDAKYVDSDWAVAGNIYINNSTPFDATLESI